MGNAESVAHGFDVEELMRDSQCTWQTTFCRTTEDKASIYNSFIQHSLAKKGYMGKLHLIFILSGSWSL